MGFQGVFITNQQFLPGHNVTVVSWELRNYTLIITSTEH